LTTKEAAGTRCIHESAFAGVAKKAALAYAGDEDVGKTIIVVIADGYSHAVELEVEASGARYVGEGAVAIIAVEAESDSLAFVTGPVHAVEKKDVLPAVVVVVEEGAARAERFREQFAAVGATVVTELDAGGVCDIC